LKGLVVIDAQHFFGIFTDDIQLMPPKN